MNNELIKALRKRAFPRHYVKPDLDWYDGPTEDRDPTSLRSGRAADALDAAICEKEEEREKEFEQLRAAALTAWTKFADGEITLDGLITAREDMDWDISQNKDWRIWDGPAPEAEAIFALALLESMAHAALVRVQP